MNLHDPSTPAGKDSLLEFAEHFGWTPRHGDGCSIPHLNRVDLTTGDPRRMISTWWQTDGRFHAAFLYRNLDLDPTETTTLRDAALAWIAIHAPREAEAS